MFSKWSEWGFVYGVVVLVVGDLLPLGSSSICLSLSVLVVLCHGTGRMH